MKKIKILNNNKIVFKLKKNGFYIKTIINK